MQEPLREIIRAKNLALWSHREAATTALTMRRSHVPNIWMHSDAQQSLTPTRLSAEIIHNSTYTMSLLEFCVLFNLMNSLMLSETQD